MIVDRNLAILILISTFKFSLLGSHKPLSNRGTTRRYFISVTNEPSDAQFDSSTERSDKPKEDSDFGEPRITSDPFTMTDSVTETKKTSGFSNEHTLRYRYELSGKKEKEMFTSEERTHQPQTDEGTTQSHTPNGAANDSSSVSELTTVGTSYSSDIIFKSNIENNTTTVSSLTHLPAVPTTTEKVFNESIPCPQICICKQMSFWEKAIRQVMLLLNPEISKKYNWYELGEAIAKQKIKAKPSLEKVISRSKSRFFKEVLCRVNSNRQLIIDGNFKHLALSKGISSSNVSFVCSDGGEIMITSVNMLLETSFISFVNCTIRTPEYIKSTFDKVGIVSVTIDNSTLAWLSNISISNLNKLYTLYVYNTPLNGRPEITNHTKARLATIYFENNEIKETDCSFMMGSTNLTLISITDNHLREIPSCLLTPNVSNLLLSRNRISNISVLFYPRIVPATNLTYLSLDHNMINYIRMFSYMKLELLDLSHNKIEYLSKLAFNRLSQLVYLDLSWNLIVKTPVGIFKAFFYLHFLNLSHNMIEEFSELHSPISHADINLQDNRLVYPPFYRDDYDIVVAHVVNAGNNPYYCDCNAGKFKHHIQNNALNKKHKIQFSHLENYRCYRPKSLYNHTLLSLKFSNSCPVVKDCPKHCDCWLNVTNNMTEVRCLKMTSFPVAMPVGRLLLFYDGNEIRDISTREYFTRAEKLNISRNALEYIDSSVCELWNHLNMLDISYNKIKYLPKCFKHFNLSTMAIYLKGNPWVCDCNSVWMINWLKENKQNLPDYNKITCFNDAYKGVPLINIDISDLDCKPKSYLEIVIPLGILALLAVILIPVAYKFRFETQVFIHARFHARPFDRKQQGNIEYKYDVFVSYSHQDEGWVVHTLMPRLETNDRKYRVCVHYRDFQVGSAVVDNIQNAVDESRCCVVILSKEYVASEWCVFEFQKAYHELIKEESRKLVVILMEDVPKADQFPELSVYLKGNTYLFRDDRWFWQKLFFCLPDPLNVPDQKDHEDKNEELHEMIVNHCN